MALGKLHPADYKQDYGSLAIKLPMNAGRTENLAEIFNLSYTTEEQSVSNYINLLLTRKGERYMQPDFGVGLHWYLFENNTDFLKTQLESEIQEQASIWLPYIFNDSIEVRDYEQSPGDSKQGLNIIIKFRVSEHGSNRTISIFPGINGQTEVQIQ